MKTLNELQLIIQDEIDKFCLEHGGDGIYAPINYILSLGGKRLRPALSLMSANLFSDSIEDTIRPALAIEVFHNFTLMHDDIMDKAPLRRGQVTVHEKWNNDVAILSGDAMLIRAYQLLMQTRQDKLRDVSEVFNKTALEVCIGQQMDMDFQSRSDVSMEEYMEMIRLKTSVLLAGAMEIGAITAGADTKARGDVYDFALHLGLSFQLRDDYLDAFGDPALTGKQNGGDILADKKTFLHIHALENAGANELQTLHDAAKGKLKDREKVNAVLEVYRTTGSEEALEKRIGDYHAQALSSLEALQVEEGRKKMLREITLSIYHRKF